MKVNELLQEATGEALKALKAELKGKSLSWDTMPKFLKSHPEWFEMKNDYRFFMKAGSGLKAGPVCKALEAASDLNVFQMHRQVGGCMIQWPHAKPISATIVLDQLLSKSENNPDGIEPKDMAAARSEQFKWAMQNATERKHDPAAKGWFVSHNQGTYPVFGRFDEGPFKGDVFAAEFVPYGKDKKPKKKGDKVRVTADSTYGRVKIVKD